MRNAITRKFVTYFVTCKTSEGNKETFVVNSSQYKASDEKLLSILKKGTDSMLVEIVDRFTEVDAYWMSPEDFRKYAQKGRLVTTDKGVEYVGRKGAIERKKKRGDLNAKENSSQTS